MEEILLIFAIISAVAGAATSAVGAVQTGDAQKKAADYNADASRQNAEAANQQAAYDAQQIRNRNQRLLATQRANYSASGVDAGGTPSDVAADSAGQGEMDALAAIYTGRTSANASEARARLDTMQGQSAQQAGQYGAATSLLSGAGQAAGFGYKAWYSGSNPKMQSNSGPRQ